jgi:hypothetical protein
MASALSTPRKRLFTGKWASTKLVVVTGLIVAVLYFVWNFGTSAWILGKHFAEIAPGRVSLIGIRNTGNFKIVVANQLAQLVEAKEGALSNDEGGASDTGGETEGAIKKRIPVKEMLLALQGDEAALSQFVSKLNDFDPNESWPTVRVVWKAEDLRKALDGDPALLKKLVNDLNVKLDGSPLPYFTISALENGIVVDTPVKVKVMVGAEERTMTARIQRPFTSNFARAVTKDLEKKVELSNDEARGYYEQHASGKKQDIKAALEALIDPSGLADAVQRAENVLGSAEVVINEKFVKKASYEAAPIGGQKLFNILVEVNEEGRERLLQYSKKHPGAQLLLVSDGVAIAAPRIRHDLWTSDFEISQMPDEVLVQDAVNSINARQR